ncbi:MAG: hypothetical protein JJU33_00885 [Phycisphaerales bacterium]|nr:hypothetical protein [Phycisphaerales bacterium]
MWRCAAVFGAAALLACCGEKDGEAAAGGEHPGDVMIAEINERMLSAPEEERAWPVYLEASKGWVEEGYKRFEEAMKRDDRRSMGMLRTPRPWHPEWEAMEAIAQEFGETIELVRHGTQRPVMGRPIGHERPDGFVCAYDMEDPRALRPEDARMLGSGSHRTVLYLRQLAWLLAADATIAAREGAVERAVSNVGAIARLGVHIGEPAMDWEQFYRMLILPIAADMALVLAMDDSFPIDSAGLDALEGYLESHLSDEVLRVDLEQHRLLLREYSEIYFEPGRRGRMNFAGLEVIRGWRASLGDSDASVRRLRASDFASRAEMVALAEALTESDERRAGQKPWEREPPMEDSIGFEDQRYHELFLESRASIGAEYRMMCADAAMQLREAARLGIALRRHKLEHAEWPADLQGLVFGELGVPLDVATGSPLAYRLTEDGPEIEAYWSRMPGRALRRDDWIVWPPEGW